MPVFCAASTPAVRDHHGQITCGAERDDRTALKGGVAVAAVSRGAAVAVRWQWQSGDRGRESLGCRHPRRQLLEPVEDHLELRCSESATAPSGGGLMKAPRRGLR